MCDEVELPIYDHRQLILDPEFEREIKNSGKAMNLFGMGVIVILGLGAVVLIGSAAYSYRHLVDHHQEVERFVEMKNGSERVAEMIENESEMLVKADTKLPTIIEEPIEISDESRSEEKSSEGRSDEVMSRLERDLTSCPTGWYYDQSNDLCYKIIHNVAYDDALRACSRMGAHIVKIDSNEKNSIVMELAKSGSTNEQQHGNMLLGAQKKRGEFVWDDASEFLYTRWAENEPNNLYGIESCIAMYTDPVSDFEDVPSSTYVSKWKDIPCDQTQRVSICEKRSRSNK